MQTGFYISLLLSLILLQDCQGNSPVIPAADLTDEYLHLLEGKRTGVVANHTSLIGSSRSAGITRSERVPHLVDSLFALLSPELKPGSESGTGIRKVFSPEHGFRGEAEYGELVDDGIDPKTGLPVVSLYGNHRKPSAADFQDLDLILFDIQDVGARFYTYISTLFYVMQTCAESGLELIILDRPNPNGFYVDGPLLEPEYSSFVGMHEVPVVYGMTIGEYGRMINGEGWLGNGLTCKLTIIPCKNYTHQSRYNLPVAPSPNLPTMNSIYLYPSTCFFEGTVISEGRGTDKPFEVFGHPDLKDWPYSFTPMSIPGKASNPKNQGKICYGMDLSILREMEVRQASINLSWLISAYNAFPDKESFFISYFENLAGTAKLRQQIIDGLSPEEIRESWQNDLEAFQKIRLKYLIYPE